MRIETTDEILDDSISILEKDAKHLFVIDLVKNIGDVFIKDMLYMIADYLECNNCVYDSPQFIGDKTVEGDLGGLRFNVLIDDRRIIFDGNLPLVSLYNYEFNISFRNNRYVDIETSFGNSDVRMIDEGIVNHGYASNQSLLHILGSIRLHDIIRWREREYLIREDNSRHQIFRFTPNVLYDSLNVWNIMENNYIDVSKIIEEMIRIEVLFQIGEMICKPNYEDLPSQAFMLRMVNTRDYKSKVKISTTNWCVTHPLGTNTKNMIIALNEYISWDDEISNFNSKVLVSSGWSYAFHLGRLVKEASHNYYHLHDILFANHWRLSKLMPKDFPSWDEHMRYLRAYSKMY